MKGFMSEPTLLVVNDELSLHTDIIPYERRFMKCY